ncbi:MAG: hypothetical protein WCK78_03135 [Paludibacter sp.]
MNYKHKILILALGLIFSCQISTAVNRYVKPQSQGTADGSSWNNASASLQQMIDQSTVGDNIYVAYGTYLGGFSLKDGVNIWGGFSGTETQVSDRQPSTQQTILSGNKTMRVLTQNVDFTTTTIIDGFVITQGKSETAGAAWLMKNAILTNCLIMENNGATVASTVYSTGGSSLINNTIVKNSVIASTALHVGDTKIINGETGVIVNVDETGQHGWMVSSKAGIITSFSPASQTSNVPRIPGIQELNDIFAQLPLINKVLGTISSSTLISITDYLWSSNAVSDSKAAAINLKSGRVLFLDKTAQLPVRNVISF